MKDEDELEMLLGEIPHATSTFNLQEMLSNATNHHHNHANLVDHGYGHASCVTQRMNGYGHAHSHTNAHLRGDRDESLKRNYVVVSSPVSGLSLQSGSSSSSLFSGGGRSHSDIDSQSPPQVDDAKPHLIPGGGFCSDFKKANESNSVDYFDLSRNLRKMCIRDKQNGVSVSVPPHGVQYHDQSPNSDSYRNSFSYHGGGRNVSVPRKPANFEGEAVQMTHDQRMANILGALYNPSQSDRMCCWSDYGSSATAPQFHRHGLTNNNFPMGFGVPSLDSPVVGNSVFYPSQGRKNLAETSDSFYSPNMAHMAQLSPHYIEESMIHYQQPVSAGRNKVPLCARGSAESFGREESLIIQGEGVNYAMARNGSPAGHNTRNFHHERRSQLDDHLHNAATQDGYRSPKMQYPLNRPLKFSSLVEARGYIYHIAKDQQGCRFLQRMFDEGSAFDVQIIFNEIIAHAVELMMNPFGNYLMQKLLEVCSERQRMLILFRVTEEPGELVSISLNTHGTRVVQKLIETLKTKQQISLVVSALEPGFLSLIKDLNGNHVIQRCLQCFPSEDSKFIFVAAAKYCVDIATHQHGCCVLQRCISHSTGEHQENLVAEISANGLLLAEDAFGNYVVQFILELKIPSATSKLTSQFKGNYVHLSTQKFSSHVVEKCLSLCNEDTRMTIIHELLSSPCFDQLLQDPHANYVVQTALRVSEGHLHDTLVNAIESYKAVSRNSPYSKRIFSQKLLKR